MHLVAVQHRLVVLKRRHQRRKALDRGTLILDEYVPQIRRLHLLLLHGGMPSHRRTPVVRAAGKLNDVEAGFEVVLAEVVGRQEAESVGLLCERMCPC